MAGDLDADPRAASIRFWAGRQSLGGLSVCYRDAWESCHPDQPGHTFTPFNPLVREGIVKGMLAFRDWPFRRIDYVFVRLGSHCGRALKIEACQRIFDEPVNGVWASDISGWSQTSQHPPTSSNRPEGRRPAAGSVAIGSGVVRRTGMLFRTQRESRDGQMLLYGTGALLAVYLVATALLFHGL